MVSAVFHSPPEAGAQASATGRATTGIKASDATASVAVKARSTKPPRQPVDWRDVWLKVLPPLIGMAVVVGIWALASSGE